MDVLQACTEASQGTSQPFPFDLIARKTRDWISWLRPDHSLQWVNDSVTRITGYTTEECLHFSTYPAKLIYSEDLAQFSKFCQSASHQTTHSDLIVRICRKDGAIVWVSLRWQKMCSPTGEWLGTLISIRDYVADHGHDYLLELRKTASRVMHQATAFQNDLPRVYSLVSESAARSLRVERVGVWLFSPASDFLECADSFFLASETHSAAKKIPVSAFPRYMASISTDQLVVANDAWHDAVTSELTESYLKPLGITSMLDAPIVLRGKTIGVLCCEHVGPQRCWESGELAFTETMADFIALSCESAERSRLEELTIRLASIIDASADLVATVDTEGKPFYINPAGRQLLGASLEQNLEHFNVRDIYSPQNWDRRQHEVIPSALAQGKWFGESEIITLHGESIPVWQSIVVHRDPDGQIQFLSSIMRDLREQKRSELELQRREDALIQLNAELEQRVIERTERLAEMNENLETFAFSVSHDLKAPLRGIDGYSRLLVDEYRAQLPAEAQSFIENIRAATESMAQLIDDLLAYSRVGRRELSPSRFSIQQLLSRVLEEFDHDIRAHGVRLSTRIADIQLTTDLDCILQILRNLIDNAIKFTREVAEPCLEISVEKNAEHIVLCVKDNGCGFDMKYHDRIFTIFQRLQRSDQYPGTGVGLAIVAKAAERLHGRVWAVSQPEHGTQFYLELPHGA